MKKILSFLWFRSRVCCFLQRDKPALTLPRCPQHPLSAPRRTEKEKREEIKTRMWDYEPSFHRPLAP
ncbi:hypothetical protein AOLI_G00115900 [Acnodon oligacanthus]